MLDAKTIGNRLKTLRGERKVEHVANALGISRSALSMYEGGHRVPRDEIKVKIKHIFFAD